ncbi:MAG: hypothetical protein FGM41_04955, partial [Bacteroidetes bacterium]|nr:hypothetical protein [Bacteroidota bacterium]
MEFVTHAFSVITIAIGNFVSPSLMNKPHIFSRPYYSLLLLAALIALLPAPTSQALPLDDFNKLSMWTDVGDYRELSYRTGILKSSDINVCEVKNNSLVTIIYSLDI